MVIVQKYGGTSVGSVERMKAVAERVRRTVAEGHQVVVVVSAMSGETDRMIGLAHEAAQSPPEREMDMLLSSGERVSAALTAMAIADIGIPSVSLTGRQAGIVTDDVHTKARIESVTADRVRAALKAGMVPVVCGFQGITSGSGGGDVTTLGRGGSDTTAVAVASGIKADLCEIYTDVDGVYTTDPRIVPEARKLERISYDEMLELASLGAKVLQVRSVEFARKHGVALVVKSSFNYNPGTLVVKEDKDMEKVVVSGVAYDRNQARISMRGVPDKPGVASRLFRGIADQSINVDMIVQNVGPDGRATDISFTVPRTDLKKARKIAGDYAREFGAEGVDVNETISKVSIVGVGMKTHSGVAAQMFDALAGEGINIMMISTSEIKVSCVIDDKYTELAVRVLHKSFGLDKAPKAVRKAAPRKRK
jgi:aspartate kinase